MTAEVIRWPRHLLRRGEDLLRPGIEMSLCRTCGGADEELTAECVGYRLHMDEMAAVRNGRIDFKGGRWIALHASAPIEK